MDTDKIIFWFNFGAMILNIAVFAVGGWWGSAVCAVVSAAVTGYDQWDNRQSIEESQ